MKCFPTYRRAVNWLQQHKYVPVPDSDHHPHQDEVWVNGRHTQLVRSAGRYYYVVNTNEIGGLR